MIILTIEMGTKHKVGTHVVEIKLKDETCYSLITTKRVTQPNELIHIGAKKNNKNAILNVKENDF